jgi:hypothetical protein
MYRKLWLDIIMKSDPMPRIYILNQNLVERELKRKCFLRQNFGKDNRILIVNPKFMLGI